MIKVETKNSCIELKISGDSDTLLAELHTIIIQLLNGFHIKDAEVLVLKELVDVTEEFHASITNKNSNSKGEKTDD